MRCLLAVAPAAAVLLAGCASASTAGGGSTSPPPTTVASTAPVTSATIGASPPARSVTPLPPASAPIASLPSGVTTGQPTTLTGTVVQGAEPSCLVLRADKGGSYLLQGPLVARVHPEQKVTVRGSTVHGVFTHCMQGTPFAVTSVVSP